MAPTAHDRAFLAFADHVGGLLQGCALLLVGDPRRAERLAATVLARRYPPDGPPEVLLVTALQELVRPRPGFFSPPWSRDPRVELVDRGGSAADAASAGPPHFAATVLGELQRLPAGQRACLVLSSYAALEPALVAAVLGREPAAVEHDTHQAVGTLAAARPERWQAGRLAEELRQVADIALPGDPDRPRAALVHGRQLRRRRRVRQASAWVAAVLVLVVGALGVLRSGTPVPQATSSSSPTPASSPPFSAACDVGSPSCRATVLRAWRTEIAQVATSHLDPAGDYFTGHSFSYDPRYETADFWEGRGGALGLEVFRLRGGATKVYVQVASDDGFAVRCGQVTRQACTSVRFMDGNRFSLTGSVEVARGIEVQVSPDGQRVVTVVARNTTAGEPLPLTTGDLLALVQDPRLRLPEI